MFDKEMSFDLIRGLPKKVEEIREVIKRPLTLTEKILYSHLHEDSPLKDYKRGEDYVFFKPDRVAMQDATAQMAILQFMTAGKEKVAVPTSVHCDHLIQAEHGSKLDLETAIATNHEVFDFLQSSANKFGMGFWKPGAGIIHQIVLENYALPGAMMVGTDSHTVNAGGLGMVAVGVGGADAVDVMVGMPWELKMPKIIGVKLTGKLNGWTAAKDVILKLAGKLTVKGGTGAIIEYIGPGARSLSCTGKATICNMGAEIGATTSVFGYDKNMHKYLRATGRGKIATMSTVIKEHLNADKAVEMEPHLYYDQVVEINLTKLRPHVNGPFTPDAAWDMIRFARKVVTKKFPEKLSVGLIGSCTNSSYEDLSRAASIARQAKAKGLMAQSEFTITPGSDLVKETIERDGILQAFEDIGGVVMANACGPCIGQWARHDNPDGDKNSIITSFNRNFSKRNDGNPKTHSFVASPEIVTAMVLAGRLTFNPMTDTLTNKDGEEVMLDPPVGHDLPPDGFDLKLSGYIKPANRKSMMDIIMPEKSDRLQSLVPFEPITGDQLTNMRLLIKARGKCTTDHISMAGPWLKYRGHLENISQNCYIGAVNDFNGKTNKVYNDIKGRFDKVPDSALRYKKKGISTIIFGEENLGEGSSREHAAMEPRFLGVKAVVVKSFARIHETNLKKQGMLALTFDNKDDYELIRQDDLISIEGFDKFAPGVNLTIKLDHKDGTSDSFKVNHTYSAQQVEWVRKGSALNLIRESINE